MPIHTGGSIIFVSGKMYSYIDETGKEHIPTAVEEFGGTREAMCWLNDRQKLDSKNDQPARIWSNGDKEWWRNGQRHRDGGKPAKVDADGSISYYENGGWVWPKSSPEEQARIDKELGNILGLDEKLKLLQ